jgi:hypothetical protein
LEKGRQGPGGAGSAERFAQELEVAEDFGGIAGEREPVGTGGVGEEAGDGEVDLGVAGEELADAEGLGEGNEAILAAMGENDAAAERWKEGAGIELGIALEPDAREVAG